MLYESVISRGITDFLFYPLLMTPIQHLQQEISEERNAVLNHPLYRAVKTEEDLRLFTSHHVFAVWDFMSLLKRLQRALTCVATPWLPVGSADTRYLINEIVIGEESDVDQEGRRCSHFELYREAMRQMGANDGGIEALIMQVRGGVPVREALAATGLPETVREFVHFTFDMVETGAVHEVASVFTFGREDLIPGMFMEMVRDLEERFPARFEVFRYYLERHIEVDGDHHSLLAIRMVEELCGNDPEKWSQAEEAARKALRFRCRLWDGILERLQ